MIFAIKSYCKILLGLTDIYSGRCFVMLSMKNVIPNFISVWLELQMVWCLSKLHSPVSCKHRRQSLFLWDFCFCNIHFADSFMVYSVIVYVHGKLFQKVQIQQKRNDKMFLPTTHKEHIVNAWRTAVKSVQR